MRHPFHNTDTGAISRRKGGWKTLVILFALLNLAAFTTARAEVKVTAKLSQNPVPANQVVNLIISIEDGELQVLPEPALPPPVGVAGAPSQSHQMTFVNGVQSSTTQIIWPISCAKVGVYTIPAFNVQVSGKAYATSPLKIEFVDGGNVAKPDAPKSALEPILQLQVGKSEFYQGEIVPVTATLYVPVNANLRRVGLIEVAKTDFAIQRFPQSATQGLESLGNVRYRTFTFPSTLSGLKAGKTVIGPTKMELVLELPQTGGGFGFGFNVFQPKKVTVEAPEIPVTVLPLPAEGKPAGFNGAVGDFTLKAASSSHDVSVGDPVSVDLTVQGQGNFDALEAPKLTDSNGWKVYPPRRYNVDNTDPNNADLMNRGLGFSQILVPEKVMPAVPPFEFSFFNPRTKSYNTLRSNAIELAIKPSAKVVPPMMTEAVGTSAGAAKKPDLNPAPVPDITDIVARVPAMPSWAAVVAPPLQDTRVWIVNGVLALGFISLLGAHFVKRRKLAMAQSDDVDRRAMLKDVESSGLSEAEFYRRVAQFLHRYTGNAVPPAAVGLLEKYEKLNFAGPGAGAGPVDPAARAEAIAVLRQIKPSVAVQTAGRALVSALVLMMGAGSVMAADTPGNDQYQAAAQAIAKDDYKTAQKTGEALVKEGRIGPELFALMGHAAYKLKNPGGAAIWYQRARLFPSVIPEVGQNLRHISERLHYFTFDQNAMVQGLAMCASRNQWALAISFGAWFAVFSITFLVLGALSKWRAWAVVALVVGTIAVALGVVGLSARPNADSLKDLVFVTASDALAHTAAAEISGHIISVPPGSTVKRLETRGAWTYVEIPQPDENVFGWLKTKDLEPVWPYDIAMLP